MPYRITGFAREEILAVKVTFVGEMRALANAFDSSHILESGLDGQKYVYPGMIVAQDTTTYKYVPYNSSAAYGTGSDTAVGILDEMLELTNGDQACTPVVHGQFIEAHCRVYGLTRGVISSTIKTHLKDIQWV